MKAKYLFLILAILNFQLTYSQSYPSFGSEIPVTINGLSFDAMEPSISADGNYIFFNSLNNGITTSLYYASKVNDSTFNFVGALAGANQTISPRLDAVASSDSANNFYWTSLRNFPTQFDNCFYGSFNGTDVINIGRVHGTFYIYTIGWLMMDASINYKGDLLYYTNAFFGPTYTGCGGVPCLGKLGIAQKQNDSTFNKLSNSDGIMQNINDTNYVVYAPNISKNGLELYYTRFLKSNLSLGTQICVSVRNNLADTFSLPAIFLPFSLLTPEATTLTSDQSKIYYHKKSGGFYQLFLRYRNLTNGINETENTQSVSIYPNPTNGMINVNILNQNLVSIKIYNLTGGLLQEHFTAKFSIAHLPSGMYYIKTQTNKSTFIHKLIRQ
jgi:Secretion system C-terminal sorting domain/WD40-like Beta Propeller Repeat